MLETWAMIRVSSESVSLPLLGRACPPAEQGHLDSGYGWNGRCCCGLSLPSAGLERVLLLCLGLPIAGLHFAHHSMRTVGKLRCRGRFLS